MTWTRRVGLGLLALAALYAIGLAVGGRLVAGRIGRGVADRIGRALGAEVTVGEAAVDLWRGTVALKDVHATRGGGELELAIPRIEAELAGWGAMVLDRDVERVTIDGAAMRLSARGLIAVARREREPLAIGVMVLRDARLELSPTAILPGLGKVTLAVSEAESRRVSLGQSLSWVSGLVRLTGRVTTPGDVAIDVELGGGELALAGSFLGSAPVRVPFRMPSLPADADEWTTLRAIGKEVLRSAGKVLLQSELKDRAIDALKGLLD